MISNSVHSVTIARVTIVLIARSFIRLRLVHKGARLGFHSGQALTILSSLPDHRVEHVCGLGHLGGVEHQADVVIHSETVG